MHDHATHTPRRSPTLAIATALLLASSGIAAAQSVTFSTDSDTRIRKVITTTHPRTTTIKERVTVGSTLPETVELDPLPADAGADYTEYRYVSDANRIYLVEPKTRKVVHVIEER